MKITVVLECEIALADPEVIPNGDDVLNALMEGFDFPSIVEQPGVEDGWQVFINGMDWSVEGAST